MLAWSLILSLATLRIAQAYPTSDGTQYTSLGQHGGVATEVRACHPRSFFQHLTQYRVDRSGNVQPSGSTLSPKVEAPLTL